MLLPSIVVVIGICEPSASASKSSCRPKRWISTPPMITGRWQLAIQRSASLHRFGQHLRSRWPRRIVKLMRQVGHHRDHVARNLDVDRPLVAGRRVQHAIDLVERHQRLVQLGAGDAQLVEHVVLRAKIAHPVVQQRIVHPLAQTRRTGDHHHRRLLGIGPGDRIAQAQPPHAIGDADGPHAMHAGVGVGREAGAILARAADRPQRALFQQRIEPQHVVARNPEDVPDAVILQAANQIFADRQARDRRGGRGNSRAPSPGKAVSVQIVLDMLWSSEVRTSDRDSAAGCERNRYAKAAEPDPILCNRTLKQPRAGDCPRNIRRPGEPAQSWADSLPQAALSIAQQPPPPGEEQGKASDHDHAAPRIVVEAVRRRWRESCPTPPVRRRSGPSVAASRESVRGGCM